MSTYNPSDGQPTLSNPTTMGAPLGLYSHVARVQAGTTYYIAGQVAVDAEGNLVGSGDLPTQLNQTFANIGAALGSLAWDSPTSPRMTTVYLTERAHVAPFYEARSRLFPTLFPDEQYPPNTLLIVAGLVRPELLIEVQLIATA